MLPRKLLIISVCLFACFISIAQKPAPKQLPAKKTNLRVKIDGLLTDSAWKDAAMMTDLIEFRPTVGRRENFNTRTESYLMYSDDGIYFGGYCYENTRDSIASELRGRDGFGTNDYVGIILDTYLDNLNGFEYFVTPLNEQWDAKMTPPNSDNGGEDFSWNAVWKSGAVIHDNGWSFEMFIPYSAIRFGKKETQNWGLNITRRRRKTEQQNTWNPIDPNTNGFLTQEGIWAGITGIKPPLRLQFSPYISLNANHFPTNLPGQKDLQTQVNGGMDLKYGINQAFTLDMTLVPDFGQVQSDNQVLNLTPFEVKFNEYRNFFTEGTELFSKGNLFYSRRIGGTPIRLNEPLTTMNNDEKLVKNPGESKLINATKVSGRTQKGLGIGILNALTRPQYATIENINTTEQRKVQTNPLTNYNILVLDQTLKNNSSITLINTNVMRSGSDYDANVTAALFDFNDKKNMYNLGGKIANSNLFGYEAKGKTRSGISSQLYIAKTSGRFTFNLFQNLTDTKYSHNDLGYFTNNNFLDHSISTGYRWTEPKNWYNRIFLNFNITTSRLFSKIPGIDERFQRTTIGSSIDVQTKKLSWLGGSVSYRSYQNDFYEPRIEGLYFRRGPSVTGSIFFESNSAKRYSFFTNLFLRSYIGFYGQNDLETSYNQNFRFNDKFSVSHSISYSPQFNSVGFAWTDGTELALGKRKVNTIENILSFKYSFNNRMGITFRTRHYLSYVEYKEFFTLQKNGRLVSNPSFNKKVDQNVNFFNIDMVYTWQFAPGSFLNIVWKDACFTYNNSIERNYFKNVNNTLNADQNNNISLKVIYFLDYLQFRKR